jgi:hypothetical protein
MKNHGFFEFTINLLLLIWTAAWIWPNVFYWHNMGARGIVPRGFAIFGRKSNKKKKGKREGKIGQLRRRRRRRRKRKF